MFKNVLDDLGINLVISREAEHFIHVFGADEDYKIPLYHPMGIAYDGDRLYLSSADKMNRIIEYEINENKITLKGVHMLAGNHYIHELEIVNGKLHFNSTGTNTIRPYPLEGTLFSIFRPKFFENQSHPKQTIWLNSLKYRNISGNPVWYYTAFNSELYEKGKANLLGRGIVGMNDQIICRDLTVPHSVSIAFDKIWVCNSGFGSFGYVNNGSFKPVCNVPGWTRGVAWYGDYCFVGYSKLYLPKANQYAPELDASNTKCGIIMLKMIGGNLFEKCRIEWDDGYQIFDIQAIPNRLSFEGIGRELAGV